MKPDPILHFCRDGVFPGSRHAALLLLAGISGIMIIMGQWIGAFKFFFCVKRTKKSGKMQGNACHESAL